MGDFDMSWAPMIVWTAGGRSGPVPFEETSQGPLGLASVGRRVRMRK
jgi:hypothetical protein